MSVTNTLKPVSEHDLDSPSETPSFLSKVKSLGLVSQIIIAIMLGSLLAVVSPEIAKSFSMLGSLFVSALKAVAPILVFVLVASSIANQKVDSDAELKPIIGLYFIGTLSAAFVAVGLSFLFPTTLTLDLVGADANPPQGLGKYYRPWPLKSLKTQ